jgi:hypothetical protein
MGHQLRAAALNRGVMRDSVRGWPRAACCCLVVFACLVQLWLPAQPWHAPGFNAHAVVNGAAGGPAATLVSFGGGKTRIHCAVHAAQAGSHEGNGPAPCDHNTCPYCPCCAPLHAALGILPQDSARLAYAPLFATVSAPPARLRSLARPASFEGRPRGPPILI